VPFSNAAVRALRRELVTVRTKVQGTDESRMGIRSKIWSTSLIFNPPSLWITINPPDTNDPIAQIFAGEEIDMDAFCNTAGPDSTSRSTTIAGDPYAAAHFFHFVIALVLETLFGIKGAKGNAHVKRRAGVFGTVQAYIGTVEAQGRGTLHLHIILWLCGAPTATRMKELLKSPEFRAKVVSYIKSTIRADLDGATASEIWSIPKENAVSYSRPVDPRLPNYEKQSMEREKQLAKAVQLHTCSWSTCLKSVGGRRVCKRRAPFALSSQDWVDDKGNWGPARICAFLNSWNPTTIQTMRCNNDVKLITNGEETKDISFYITNYAAKKQTQSSNISVLLAKRLLFHQAQEKKHRNSVDINKRLIQRCANTLSREQELPAPQVVSYLMGWGDRYISHNFVANYWDSAVLALKEKFPELKKRA
jgi:hypothetical protein